MTRIEPMLPSPSEAAPLSAERPAPPPHDIVTLERVHARDRAAPRERSRGALNGLDLVLDARVHAFVGAPEDGTIALSEILAGADRPRRGRVLVAGRDPGASAAIRARIGALSATPRLPPARTVDAAVRLAMRARGETGDCFDAVLDPFGLSTIHGRATRSLSYAEARAVELALALTTPAPVLVVLHEPFVDVATGELALIRQRLRAVASSGGCVVLTTSSVADARAVADRIYVLTRGNVARSVGGEGLGLTSAEGELVIWVRRGEAGAPGVRELAAALGRHGGVRQVSWDDPGAGAFGGSLRVRGELDACALAVADAAVETGAVVDAVTTVAPGLADVQATTERLLARARAAAPPLAPAGSPRAASPPPPPPAGELGP